MSEIALVLLWLGTSASYLHLQSDLDAWSRARQVRLVAPASSPAAAAHYDAAAVEKIEQRLEQARILSDSGDEPAALEALADVERRLVQGAALPQAPWLMAERLRLELDIQQAHPERGAAEQIARALAALEPPADPGAGLPITGVAPNDAVFVDGRRQGALVALAPGRHHVRVLRRDAPVWAGWVSVGEQATSLDLPVPEPAPCSREDLGEPRIERTRVVVSPGVRCPSWAVARPRAGGGVEIARCRQARCGALLPWQKGPRDLYAGPPQTIVQERQRWPLWVLAGAGAAIATSLVLWQAGVFDRDDEPRFVVQAQGPPEAGAGSGR